LGAAGRALADRRARSFRPDFVLCTRHAHLLGERRLRRLLAGRDAAVWYFDAAPRPEVIDLARLAGALYVTYLAQVPDYAREVPVVRFLPQGLDPDQDHPAARVRASRRCDASFVGSGPFPHRWPLLRAIAAACRLQIRGPGWDRAPADLPVAGGEVRGRAFAEVVAGAAVNLGASAVPAQDRDHASASNRMWKVLGCGGFYLGPRVPGIEAFARDGEHCRWYGDVEEAVALTRWALAEPERRAEIATAGRRHALAHHTYAHRLELLLAGRGYEFGERGTGNGER
ncbi:MAG TPA: glycosyltransferase, partial [Gemmatimonadales bacterium]|nr:glycosyltransferase [Gemmatimonadales bacterium]